MSKWQSQSSFSQPTVKVFYPTETPFHGSIAPDLRNKDFEISAEVLITADTEGVILANGDNSGGLSLFIKDGKLHFYFNNQNIRQYLIRSKETLEVGHHQLVVKHEKQSDNQGNIRLYADDVLIGEGIIKDIDALGFFNGLLHIGYNELSYITPYYQNPFSLGEQLKKVSIQTESYQTDLKAVVEKELATE